MRYPKIFEKVKNCFKNLPGVGEKTAERFALDLLEWDEELLKEFSSQLGEFHQQLRCCSVCGILMEEVCQYCSDPRREKSVLVVVAHQSDFFSLQRTGFRGSYHVLGGLLDPMKGEQFDEVHLKKLQDRLSPGGPDEGVQEVILALDATLLGDTTAHYIKEALTGIPLKVSRLAFGLPMGSSLQGIDLGTISQAINYRLLM